jgi:hypothetical protein
MDKDNKKPKVIPIFWPDRNIAEYFNLMEREVNKIYDSYDFPRPKISELKAGFMGAQNYKQLLEIAEKSDRGDNRIPYSLQQALALSPLIDRARQQLSDNKAEELAFSIGTMCAIIGSGSSDGSSQAGKNNLWRVAPFTVFLLDVINATESQIPECTSTDVIDNIENYYEDFDSDYPKVLVKKYANDDFDYKLSNPKKPDIKRSSLVTRINNLRKKSIKLGK